MDARAVYQRPPADQLTPVQKLGFDLVDTYLEQGVPAYLSWFNVPDSKLQAMGTYVEDDRYKYVLLIRRGGRIVNLQGWQVPGKRVTALRPPHLFEEWVSELTRRELALIEATSSDQEQEVPLLESDLQALGLVGIDPEGEPEPETVDDSPEDQGTQPRPPLSTEDLRVLLAEREAEEAGQENESVSDSNQTTDNENNKQNP